MLNTPCPICSELRPTIYRYRNSVCKKCINTGTFADSSQTTIIEFSDATGGMGFVSTINGVDVNQHSCYIKGFRCFATEGKFGGIIISYNENENLS